MIVLVGFAITVAYSRESYKDLDIFAEAFSYVTSAYVEPSKAEPKKLIYGAINGMLSALEDPFTRFMAPEAHKNMETEIAGQFGGLGIVITIKDGKLIVISPIEDTPAWKIGVRADDCITHIDGTSTEGITLQGAVSKLRGQPGTDVTITIARSGESDPIIYTITRDIIKIKTVKWEVVDDKIVYMRITSFNNNTTSELDEAISKILEKNPEYIILDIRNNGGGTLQASVGALSRFVDQGTLIVYTKGREGTPELRYYAEDSGRRIKQKMAVLINGGTASGAEIVAGALKDYKRGVLLGKKTFGKASVQTVYSLSDGSGLALTTGYYYTPAGNLIHNKGIEPEIVVDCEEIPEEKRRMIQKFEDGDFSEDFVGKYSTWTDKEISEFIESLNKQGINIEKKYILRDLEKERRKSKEERLPIADLYCDNQLLRAIELIKVAKFFKE